jgi:hypothetical protein
MSGTDPTQPQPQPPRWGEPGYTPPGKPPAPPRRPGRTALIVVAAITAALTLVGIGLAVGSHGSRLQTAATAPPETKTNYQTGPGPTDEFTPPASEPATEDTTPEVWKGGAGDVATVTMDGEDAAELTVGRVDAFKTASSFGLLSRPANGWFVKTTLKAHALRSGFDLNEFDFYVRVAGGRRFDVSAGNASEAAGDNDLQATTLTKGERLTATMTFDLPARHGALVYAPGDTELGEWRF